MSMTKDGISWNRRWGWVLGLLLGLAGIGLLWSCAAKSLADADPAESRPAVIKTTIRITKGRPGMITQWEVSDGTEGTKQYGQGAIIPLETWKHMNGTITAFTKYGCDGMVVPDTKEVYYRTQLRAGEPTTVQIAGSVGGTLEWDFTYCNDMTEDCPLPERYFNPVLQEKTSCSDTQPEFVWVIEITN